MSDVCMNYGIVGQLFLGLCGQYLKISQEKKNSFKGSNNCIYFVNNLCYVHNVCFCKICSIYKAES